MLPSVIKDAAIEAGLQEQHFSICFKTKVTQPPYQHSYCRSFTYLQTKSVVIISSLASIPIDSVVDFGEEQNTGFKP